MHKHFIKGAQWTSNNGENYSGRPLAVDDQKLAATYAITTHSQTLSHIQMHFQ